MALSTQVKILRAMHELLLGEGRGAFAVDCKAKPEPPASMASSAPLPRSIPEQEGVPSEFLDDFFRHMANKPESYLHSLLVLRHGKVIAEGYFAPYQKDCWHVVHSLAKTLTGTAVGIAIEEGLFGLNDYVADYFPDKLPRMVSRRLKKIQVRHLLTMTSGITFNEVSEVVERDWVRGIFASTIAFDPGSKFVYNSMNSYLLSALIHKTSGEPLGEYLKTHLFTPMGFAPIGWEQCPAGSEKGGWGLYITPEDMAKIGQLYLQKGSWIIEGEPRQLVPKAWIEQAASLQVCGEKGEEYGYQLWVDSRNKTYIMNGLFGQYVIVLPRLDMVITMTAGNSCLLTESPAYQTVQEFFYTHSGFPASVPEQPKAYENLRNHLENLQFRQPYPGQEGPAPAPAYNHSHNPLALEAFLGATWQFPPSRAGLLPFVVQTLNNNFTGGVKALRLLRSHNHVILLWEEGEVTFSLPIGLGQTREATVEIDGETFRMACRGSIRDNEDLEPVFIIEVFFLEHSSYRIIKLIRQNENVLVKLDEQPQIRFTLEAAMNLDSFEEGGSSGTSFGDLFRGNDYLRYRVDQLCTPHIVGTPVEGWQKPV